MNDFAISSLATTTCQYFYTGSLMASSTCNMATYTSSSTPLELSTDPVVAVILAAGLMVLSGMYVRRVFFS